MKTFKIKDNDLSFDGSNNIEIVEGKDEEVQSVERVLTTNTGEWFLNELHGLAYKWLQRKQYNGYRIRTEVAKAILQEDRVKEIKELIVDIDRPRRKLKIDFEVLMKSGNTLTRNEVIDIG
ncbi:hypothetical protein [Dethiothermospora halolimnae]|uniref:hypothetical protein n=1 Tax=Dethiothermospora halolimnae TaxID=3114390 RepID=UPI003CCC103A